MVVETKANSTGQDLERKTLTRCFDEARQKFSEEIANPAIEKDQKQRPAVVEFLKGIQLGKLENSCKELSNLAEDKANNNAAKLWATLDQLKGAADVFLQFAPESISIVWFGISSLITVGNARTQTRLLICGTCDSIATIISDCIRWEARMVQRDKPAQGDQDTPKFDIWDSDMPDLVFSILDFLWNARPHLSESRVKRLGSSLKDLLTKELDQKVNSMLAKYKTIVEKAQAHFEEFVFHESLKYIAIGSEVIDAIQQQALLYELDRHVAKLSNSASHRTHFASLNDRFDGITRDRNGRVVAKWLFKEPQYRDWKDGSEVDMICLRGPRGHGKSVAMLSVYRDAKGSVGTGLPPLLCHFFFKKGDKDIQGARTGIESILHQLLSSEELRNDTPALVSVVEILNPLFGELELKKANTAITKFNFMLNLESLCETIRGVAEAIRHRVYIMIDALDECQDRQEQNLTQLIKGLLKSRGDGLRVIISTRDSIDIVNELISQGIQKDELKDTEYLPQNIKIIEITAERNSADLEEYLAHDVGGLLARRIDKSQFIEFFNIELARIVKIIHQKAKGDFTLARMIIANLQQPSKDSLEQKVQSLPAAIGEIYMSSIESLSPDEQELVVSTLKWVVWGASGITVVEISDHYRELYGRNASRTTTTELASDAELPKSPQEISYLDQMEKFIQSNPYQDPEIKDIIHHLENAGRDFFKFDRNTGIVGVDISIREWIQEDTKASRSKTATRESRGFNKYRDGEGNTVFKFTLTREFRWSRYTLACLALSPHSMIAGKWLILDAASFVRYGDNLSQLFNQREAHMSIALSTLRALNNSTYQAKYMPWTLDSLQNSQGPISLEDLKKAAQRPEGFDPYNIRLVSNWRNISLNDNQNFLNQETIRKPRYEIDHWHDHIRILQTWWNDGSLDDAWWSELLTELCIFTRPENWYRWTIHAFKELSCDTIFKHPIHVACELGLHLLVDFLVCGKDIKARTDELYPRDPSNFQEFKFVRTVCITSDLWVDPKSITSFLGCMEYDEILDFLGMQLAQQEDPKEGLNFLRAAYCRDVIMDMPPELRITWLAYQILNMPIIPSQLTKLYQAASGFAEGWEKFPSPSVWHPNMETEVHKFLEETSHNKTRIAEKLRSLTNQKWALDVVQGPICDLATVSGSIPFHLGAPYPLTIKCLINHGADINPELQITSKEQTRFSKYSWGFRPKLPPLYSILDRVACKDYPPTHDLQQFLESATILISAGANLDCKPRRGKTLIHLAARIRDLRFFKYLCVSSKWDIHAVTDKESWTPLHFLLLDPPPTDPAKIKEILAICEIMMNMRLPDGPDLINAEDSNSETPLALAVAAGFTEAVRLLIDLGADVHDENLNQQNCFHRLAGAVRGSQQSNPEADILIANMLFEAGLDCTKIDSVYGWDPLRYAIDRKAHLVDLFLPKSQEYAKRFPENNPFLELDCGGRNLLLLVVGSSINQIDAVRIFKQIAEIISEYTDITQILQGNLDRWETALELACGVANMDMVKAMMSYNIDINFRQEGRLGTNFTDSLVNLIEGNLIDAFHASVAQEISIQKEILYYLLELKTPDSFSLFETHIFGPEYEDKLEEILDLGRIFAAYRDVERDEHGWTLYDILSINGRSHLLKYTSEKVRSDGNFSTPSKIGKLHNFDLVLKRAESGLECFSSELVFTANHTKYSFGGFLSNHPVPPSNNTFYFEIELPKTLVVWSKSRKWGIGFERLHHRRLSPQSCWSIVYHDDGVVTIKGESQMWPCGPTDIETATKESNFCRSTSSASPPRIVGSGINPLTGAVFFTIDGIMLPHVWRGDVRRYFPYFEVHNPPDMIKVNYGARPFAFQEANNPAWKWDERVNLDTPQGIEFSNSHLPDYESDSSGE
ncbi:hypothetical protein TWF694_002566 [Orbilia ellipsospora]|uniref:B30.2/SPRY domain-containing protein n=1 Tax=Orbilia ellipsospora TaxID=2528407 RepID=A0AAV9X3N9_9PEZI